MKLTVLSDNITQKIPLLSRGISSRSQIPVLLNILLEAKDGKLYLSSTDLEIGIKVGIPANIEEEGSTTTPAKTFLDLLNSLTSEKITINTKDSILEIKTQKTKSTLQTINASEFPKLYEEKGIEIIKLKKKVINEDFSKILFAASIDPSRQALSGVYVKPTFTLVATDGYRLSLKQSKIEPKDFKEPIIIPVKILREIISLKEEKEDVLVFISQEKNQVLFEQGDIIIVGRLIGAKFPDYEKIIPQESSITAVFDRNEMFKAVKTGAIFARDAANIIRFLIKEDKIVVSANAPQVGENSVDVEAKVNGGESEIAFNVRYLLEFLNVVDDEDIIFEMTTPTAPGVFKIKGDPTFLHIIMPIRVQTE